MAEKCASQGVRQCQCCAFEREVCNEANIRVDIPECVLKKRAEAEGCTEAKSYQRRRFQLAKSQNRCGSDPCRSDYGESKRAGVKRS